MSDNLDSDNAALATSEPPKLPNKRPGILALAGPAALGNLLMSSVGIINIKMVGSFGTEAIAAVSTGGRIFFIFQSCFLAVNAGTTALVARHWGAGNYDQAASILYLAIIINSLFAICCSVLLYFFSADMVTFFGLNETTTRLAGEYLSTFGLFAIGFALNLSFAAALRASGNALIPLYLGVFANISTVAISYLLIFGGWGIKPLGVVGSAIGGGSGFLLSAISFYILWQLKLLPIKTPLSYKIDKATVNRLFQIGYPAGIEQIVLQCGFLSFLWVVAFYGTEAFAAYGIGVTILSFSFVIGVGFSIAGSTLVGQNLGAQDVAAAKASGWRAMRWSIIVMTTLGAIIIAFARPIASFLVDDKLVIEHTVTFIYILGAVQPLMAIDFALGGALRGAGDTRFPLLSSLSTLLLVRIGLSMLFLKLGLSVTWVYSALIFDYILKSILLTHRFHSEKWAKSIKHF